MMAVFFIHIGIVQTSIPSLLSTSVSPTASLAQVLPSSQSLNITQGKVLTLSLNFKKKNYKIIDNIVHILIESTTGFYIGYRSIKFGTGPG